MSRWQDRARNLLRRHRWALSNMRGVYCAGCMLSMEPGWLALWCAPLCPKASEPTCRCLGDYCERLDCDW